MERKRKTHFLLPGNLIACEIPYAVSTILGSCISLCLWDRKHKMGGINHYLLPLWNGRGLQSPKYGNIAIDKLISKMLNLGSNINDLQAKIFGGASVLENSNKGMRIGEQNIIIVNDMLAAYKIPIISSSVGGFEGIKLIFHSDNGAVFLKRTHKSQE